MHISKKSRANSGGNCRRKRVLAKENEIEAIQREQLAQDNLQKALKLIRIDELTAEELAEMINIYPKLEMNVEYKPFTETGQIYRWNGNLYKIVQKHTTQSHYNLDELPALYTKVVPKSVIRTIPDPIPAGEAFINGEKGIWTDGKVYENTLDVPNTWTPSAYPTGWKVVE